MKILFEIDSPAQVHFFRPAIELLTEDGHESVVLCHGSELARQLLEGYGIPHEFSPPIAHQKGLLNRGKTLIQNELKQHSLIRKYKPNIIAFGSFHVATYTARLAAVPTVLFFDEAEQDWADVAASKLAYCSVTPRCYSGPLPPRHIRYTGLPELAYLHHDVFTPDPKRAGAARKHPIILVSLPPLHQREAGLFEAMEQAFPRIEKWAQIVIAGDGQLPESWRERSYQGEPLDFHHFLAHCKGVIGANQTMAMEAAILNVPTLVTAPILKDCMRRVMNVGNLIRHARWDDEDELDRAFGSWLTMPEETMLRMSAKLHDKVDDVARLIRDCLVIIPKHKGSGEIHLPKPKAN